MAITINLFNSIKQSYVLQPNNILSENIKKIESILNNKQKKNWRIKKSHPVKVFKNTDADKNQIISYLNKITSKTYDTLSKRILDLCKNETISQFVIENIFNIAIKQPFYCINYVHLAKLIITKFPVINSFIEEKCKLFFSINKNNNSKDSLTLNYNEFCENNKLKLMKEGYSKFIGELFKASIINYEQTFKTLDTFVNTLEDVLKETEINKTLIEDNIICITELYKTIHNHLNNSDKKYIEQKIDLFIKNKSIIKRLIFKLMDLKDCS